MLVKLNNFIESLHSHQNVTIIDLHDDGITDESLNNLINTTDKADLSHIVSVNFSNNEIRQLETVSKFLNHYNINTLMELNLKNNNIYIKEQDSSLFNFVRLLSSLVSIDLSNNKIPAKGIFAFFAYLNELSQINSKQEFISLKEFNFINNSMDLMEYNDTCKFIIEAGKIIDDFFIDGRCVRDIKKDVLKHLKLEEDEYDEESRLLDRIQKSYNGQQNIVINASVDDLVSLNPETEINASRYRYTIRWLSRNRLFDKLVTYPFISSFKYANNDRIIKVKSHIHYFLRSSTLPQTHKKNMSRILIANSFLEGTRLFTEKFWPFAFSSLLISDFIEFSFPANRYGVNIWDILGGTAENQVTLGSHLGSDLAGEWQYWLGISLTLAGAISSGVLYTFWQRRHSDDFNALWDKDLTVEKRNQWIEKTKITAFETGFKQWRAMSKLANIVDTFDTQSLLLSGVFDNEHETYNKFTRNALTALIKLSNQNKSKLTSLYANYLLWSLGQEVRKSFQPLFVMFTGYLLFTKLRLWELAINKVAGVIEYIIQKNQCENNNKIFMYLPDYGNYECGVCPDWLFVLPQNVFTSQGCLNGLLASDNPPEFILNNLNKVLIHSNITSIDFSSQNWLSWTEAQWNTFLTSIAMTVQQLNIFNISSDIFNPNFPDDGRIDDLVKFLNSVKTSIFDIKNQGIGSTQANKFSSVISSLNYLDISSNQLTNVDFLKNSTSNLKTLKIADNLIGNDGLNVLSSQLANTTLTELDVSRVGADETGLKQISRYLGESHLRKLEVTGNDFSQADMSKFGHDVSSSQLEDINLSQTQLSDQQAIDFVSNVKDSNKSQLKKVDFSENDLTDQGAVGVIMASQNSALNSVNLGGNVITDLTLQEIGKYLPQTAIQELGFSNTQITSQGFQQLADQSQIISLDISNNPIGDEVAQILSQYKTPLEKVDLSSTGMTDVGGINLATAIPGSNLKVLTASNNQLTDSSFVPISQNLPSTKLEEINFSQNEIGPLGATALSKALPNSRIQHANLEGNQITDESGIELAKSLIEPTPHIDQVAQNEIKVGLIDITRDEVRSERNSKPNTKLKTLNLKNNPLGKFSQRAFRRTLPSTNATVYQNYYNQTLFNNISERNMISSTPQSLTSSSGQYMSLALLGGTLPEIVLGMLALYLVYRICKSVYSAFDETPKRGNLYAGKR